MIYRLISKIIKTDEPDNSKAVAERHAEWDRDVKKQEDVGVFLTTSRLGRLLVAQDPSLMELSRGFKEPTPGSRPKEPDNNVNHAFDSKCEVVLHEYYSTLPPQNSEQPLNGNVGHLSTSPLSKSHSARCQTQCNAEAAEVLPPRLVEVLLQRWQLALERGTKAGALYHSAKNLPNKALSGLSLSSLQSKLLDYLGVVIPCWNVVLASNPAFHGPVLSAHGVEHCVLDTLLVLSDILLAFERVPEDEYISADDGDELGCKKLSREHLLRLIEKLLDILLGLYLRQPSGNADLPPQVPASRTAANVRCRATQLSNQELAQGCPPFFLRNKNMATTMEGSTSSLSSSSHSVKSETFVDPYEMVRGLVELLRHISKASLISSPFSSNLMPETKASCTITCKVFLVLCTLPASRLLKPSAINLDEEKQVVSMPVMTVSVLMAQFIGTCSESFAVSACGSSTVPLVITDFTEGLLHQLTCGMLLVTHWLQRFPVVVLQALNSSGFIGNLYIIMQFIGMSFTNASYSKPEKNGESNTSYCKQNKESTVILEEFVNLDGLTNEDSLRLWSGTRILPRPELEFHPVAAEDAVDEFLYSYLGLIVAQRAARRSLWVLQDKNSLDTLDELRLTVLKVFTDLDLQSQSDASKGELHQRDNCDVGLISIETLRTSDTNTQEVFNAPTAPAMTVDGGLAIVEERAFKKLTKNKLCDGSCLYDLLIQQTLGSLSESTYLSGAPCSSRESPLGKQDAYLKQPSSPTSSLDIASQLEDFDQLVDAGLYRIFFSDERFFEAYRGIPRLCHGALYTLQHALTFTTDEPTPLLNDPRKAGQEAACTMARGNCSAALSRAVVAALSVFALRSTHCSSAFSGSKAPNTGAMVGLEKRPIAAVEPRWVRFQCGVCAVVEAGLRGPKGDAVRDALMGSGGFACMIAVAVGLCREVTPRTSVKHHGAVGGTSLEERSNEEERPVERDEARDYHSGAPVARWATHFVLELTHGESAEAEVLSKGLNEVFSLLSCKGLQKVGEEIIVRLLCHSPGLTCSNSAIEDVKYKQRLRPLISMIWDVIGKSEGLGGGFSIKKQHSTHSTTNGGGEGTPLDTSAENFPHAMQGSPMNASYLTENITVLVLRCLRRALYRLRHGLPCSSLQRVRMLQNTLCNQDTSEGCFLKLIHCVSRPWLDSTMHAEAVRSVLQTLVCLIAGCPSLRTYLFSVITPHELVECICAEWLIVNPSDWKGVVEAFIAFIYEEIDEADKGAVDACTSSREGTAPLHACPAPPSPDHTQVACSEQKRCYGSIQNAVVLRPLLDWLRRIVMATPSDGTKESVAKLEALDMLLKTLHNSFARCRVSRFICARAGLFAALAQLLLTLMDSVGCTSNSNGGSLVGSVLNSVMDLMKVSAVEHVDIKHVKRLLLMVVNSSNARQREKLAPLVINILSVVATTFLSQQVLEPQNYIAFCRNSGAAGVKAMIQEYPAEGYSICLWVRVEKEILATKQDEAHISQTIFSLQNSDSKTQLRLNVSPATGSLSLTYLDSQKRDTQVDVGFSIPLACWVHLAFVHRPCGSSIRSHTFKNATIFKNGEELPTRLSVPYSSMIRGWLLVGTDGELADQLSCEQSLVGQVATMNFFVRPLQHKEIRQLCRRSFCGYCEDAAVTFTEGSGADCVHSLLLQRYLDPMRYPSLSHTQPSGLRGATTDVSRFPAVSSSEAWACVETSLIAQATICIDPRLSERGKLYNLSSLMRGRSGDNQLIVFEATLICCSTSIIDALYVLGAVYTVVMPLLMLLVSPQLPFSERPLLLTLSEPNESVPHVGEEPTSSVEAKERNDAARDMLQLLYVLAHDNVVRVDMAESGLFFFIANVLQQLGPALDMTIPERILSLCVEQLLSSDVLFEAAYTAFFLSSSLLHACSYTTQLIWINCQRIYASMNSEVRSRIRALGAQMFIVSELQFTILHYTHTSTHLSAKEEGDLDDKLSPSTATVEFSLHGKSLYEELFRFFEALTVDPVTMADAVPILHLTTILYQSHQQLPEEKLIYVLRRIRVVLSTRDPLLCQFLGREDYLAVLLLFLKCPTVPVAARKEVILQIILLVCRSKYTQKFINPVFLVTENAVHTPQDISLVWLKEYFGPQPIDIALYLALRSTLFGEFVISDHLPLAYTPLSGASPIEIPAVLELILSLIQTSHDSSLRACVLNDIVLCLNNEPKTWQKLIAIQGWYALIADIYTSERKCLTVDEKPLDASHGGEKHDPQSMVPPSAPATSNDSTPSDRFLLICSFILSFTLSQALMNVNYAASEQELVVMYLQEQGLHVLLNHVLCGMADCLRTKLLANTETNSTMFMLPNTGVMHKNLTAFVYTVENVLFYSGSYRASSDSDVTLSPRSLSLPNNRPRTHGNPRYVEWNELVAVVKQDAKPLVEGSDSALSSSNPLALHPPIYLAEESVRYVSETHFASREGRHELLSSPDGRWLHMSLALKVAYLLTTNESIFSGGCMQLPAGTAELAHANDIRSRKGGFLRILERLLRVSSSMMLNSVGCIEALLQLLDRYAILVPAAPSGLLSLIRSKTSDDYKNHSPVTTTMSILYCIHNLLLRRLRAAGHDNQTKYSPLNSGLIHRFRRLFSIFKNWFERMVVFALQGDKPSVLHASEAGVEPVDRVRTLSWLCAGADRPSAGWVDEFLDVTGRVDYAAFLKRCLVALERNCQEARVVAGRIPLERQCSCARLGAVWVGQAAAQAAVRRSIDALRERVGTGKGLGDGGDAKTLQAASATALAVALVRFREHLKDTIWCPESEGVSVAAATRYTRLSLVEQQPLMRCKMMLDRNGTSHRAVSELSRSGRPPSPLAALSAEKTETSLVRTPLRLRGEEFLWEQGGTEDDKGRLGTDGEVNPENEQDGYWSDRIYNPAYYLQTSSPSPTFSNGAFDEEFVSATDANLPPIVLSIPCEMPYMMHCWSAMFIIRGMAISVIIDEENKAYNQQLSPEALPFLIRPQSFGFNIAMIAQVAPGRRFRMKRTAIEVWLHSRRSCLLNFPDTATMRLAMKEIVRKVFVGNRLRDPRRVLSIRSFYVFQENPLKEPLLKRSMDRWRKREVSNFDYLMWLNMLAGRSLNDITQYPVFPWILADYTSETLNLEDPKTFRDLSKPVGANGDDKRRERIRQLYEETKAMGDAPSHYFTHYSSAAVVLYYLMRLEPFTTLHVLLQGGRFDHPDRMFHAISATFRGVTGNMQDTRELIPELFYLPELCVNHNDVFFGRKQNNELVSNLVLPPWAHGSPHDFIYHMRESLECDYVSSMLHHWIDLVFGVQQRGKEAIKALNVFRWHSYEDFGSSHANEADQHHLLDILDNIGQTPIQLFRQSHPLRQPQELLDPLVGQVALKVVSLRWEPPKRVSLISFNIPEKVIVVNGNGATITLKLAISPLKRSTFMDVCRQTSSRGHSTFSAFALSVPARDSSHVASGVTSDRVNLFPSLSSLSLVRSELEDGVEISTASSSERHNAGEKFSFDISEDSECHTTAAPLSVVPDDLAAVDGPCTPENAVLLCFDRETFLALGGLFDHSVAIRHLSQAADDVYLRAHRGRVIRLAASGDSHYLVTGSEDTTFVVWTCHLPRGQRRLEVQPLFTIYRHEDLPTAVHLSSTLDVVATASMDGMLMLHSLSTASLERTLRHPRQYPIHHILVQSTCYVPNVLFYSKMDHVVHQISLNGTMLRSFSAPGRLLCWATTPEQYLLMHCAPFNQVAATVDHRTNLLGESVIINTTAILYVHSFFMKTLRTVSLPTGTTVSTMACHPKNPQVVMLGDMKGSITLVRTCALKSSVLA